MDATTQQHLYLGRQPILDRQGNLVAFELLFRSGVELNAHITDDVQASATVISNIIGSLGIDDLLGTQHKGFINLDAFLLKSDAIELLPKDRVVFELLETIHVDDSIVARCQELKARGFTLALDDFVHFSEEYKPLLDIVDIVKIDLPYLRQDELKQTVAKLREWPVKLVAEKVDSPEQYQYCLDLGFDLFQGYHFARPLVVVGRQFTPSELALIRLQNLLLKDAEILEIETLLKTQPELIVRLMRLVNSVGMAFMRRITSIHDAVVLVGRNQLMRWLKLLLYSQTSHQGKPNEPLLQMASQRARLMELLALNHDANLADEAFMTGTMSLLGALFNMPIEDVLLTMNLDDNIERALLGHEGKLGDLLKLAELFEANDLAGISKAIAQIPWLDLNECFAAQQEAIIWTNQIVSEMG